MAAVATNGDAFIQNGNLPTTQLQAEFYAKLARLGQEVLTGRHPQFKFSNTDVEQLASLFLPAPAPVKQASAAHAPKAVPNGVEPPVTAPQPAQSTQTVQQPALPLTAAVSLPHRFSPGPPPVITRQSVPQIDPILLVKSDGLVRAEINLKRQRIEKVLKDTLQAKKKHRPNNEVDVLSVPQNFDVADVLQKAFALVPPHAGSRIEKEAGRKSPSSFGDGYYSSRGNSWSPDQGVVVQAASVPAQASATSNAPAPAPASVLSATVQVPIEPNKGRVSGLGPRSPPLTKRAVEVVQAEMQNADASEFSGNAQTDPMDTGDSLEESYSPPSADALGGYPSKQDLSMQQAPGQDLLQSFMTPANLSDADDCVRDTDESYSPPPAPASRGLNNPMIPLPIHPRLHGTASRGPFAQSRQGRAQAATKISKVVKPQVKNVQKKGKKQKVAAAPKNKYQPASAQPSPAQAGNAAPARVEQQDKGKKRRFQDEEVEEDTATYRAYRSYGEHTVLQAHIKTEPRSPQPISASQAPQAPRRLVLRDDGGTDIEILAPEYSRAPEPRRPRQVLTSEGRRPAHPLPSRYIDSEPIWIDDSDVPPPPVRRRLERTGPQLDQPTAPRRVASPIPAPVRQALPYPDDDDVQYVRTRDARSGTRSMPEDVLPQVRPRYTLGESAFPRGAQYDDYINPRESMPPPPKRRRFVDEYGNEFIAIPTRSILRASAVPEEPRYREQLSLYDPPFYRDAETVSLPREALRASLRSPAYAADPISPRRAVSHVPEVGPYQRASSHASEYQPVLRAQPRIIELADEDADYRRMPPPPPRLMVRKRPIEAVEEPAQYPGPYQTARSASLQPALRQRGLAPERYVSAGNWPAEGVQAPIAPRAYSARPGQDLPAVSVDYGRTARDGGEFRDLGRGREPRSELR